jgi:hypothetical protein
MLVMKHERMKLLTFRTEEWTEESNEVLKWRPETSKNREFEMARAWGGERRKYIARGLYSWFVVQTWTTGEILFSVRATNRD